MPEISLPFPDDLLPIGLGALVVVAAVGLIFGGGGEEGKTAPAPAAPVPAPAPAPPAPAAVDLSIPYDAAARLAFTKTKGSDNFDGPEYAKFKAEYEAKAVEDVIAKKKA